MNPDAGNTFVLIVRAILPTTDGDCDFKVCVLGTVNADSINQYISASVEVVPEFRAIMLPITSILRLLVIFREKQFTE